MDSYQRYTLPRERETNRANLPAFPRPDLPEAHPDNYPTLKVRVLRRLGLPDDGGMWIHDAISDDILTGYNGTIVNETRIWLDIAFTSLSDAVSWADLITTMGNDREMISFLTPPADIFGPATIRIRIGR